MAVPRVEWRCPQCQRRYAIRAEMPTPQLCPRCRAEAEPPTEIVAGSTLAPARGMEADTVLGADFDFTAIASESAVAASPTTAAQARASQTGVRSLEVEASASEVRSLTSDVRPRYPALRTVSLVYKIVAILSAVGAVVSLGLAANAAFGVSDAALRRAEVLTWLASFAGAALGAVTLFAFAELIQLLIDLEHNTRRRG